MGIFWRNSNWGLRYGGAASPTNVMQVWVVGTELWWTSLERETTPTWMEGGKEGSYGHLEAPRLQWLVWAGQKAAEAKASYPRWAWGLCSVNLLCSKARGRHRKGWQSLPTQLRTFWRKAVRKKGCLKSNGSKWKFAAKSGELSLWTFLESFVLVAFQLCDCSTRTLLFDTGWHMMSIACAGEPQGWYRLFHAARASQEEHMGFFFPFFWLLVTLIAATCASHLSWAQIH